MKNFIVVFFALCSFYSFSQQKHKDGPYKAYYDNGKLKTEGFYKNDKKFSAWKDYYDNGQIKKLYTYKPDGKLSGIEESYSKNGKLVSEVKRSKNGGLIAKHYFESGKLSVIYALIPSEDNKRFVKAGGYKEYYENDTLKIESTYSNNELSGLWKQYYVTGEKEWEVVYFNGYRQGSYKQFYKNGLLKLEGWNVADLKNGKEKRYDEKGSLLWEGSYLKGDFDDLWQQYDSVGNVTNSLKYKKGRLKNASNSVTLNKTEVPDGLIEKTPVYPGCEHFLGNEAKRKCLSENIEQFVSKNFNLDVIIGTGIYGIQRINVLFKINKTGLITDISARAKYSILEKEAVKTISKLPKMTPGIQFGKPVIVPYSLPIVLGQRPPEKGGNNYYNPYSGKKKF